MQPQPRYQPSHKIGGRYQVHQALMGGMGEVYLCLDLETIQPYALKTFQARCLTSSRVSCGALNVEPVSSTCSSCSSPVQFETRETRR